MQLFYSALSPFSRKVRVCAYELGLTDRITLLPINPWTDEPYKALNPLGQVPALVFDDGLALYGSPVICEALNEMAGGQLIPASGPARWAALTRQALGDGLGDAAIRIVLEKKQDAPRGEAIAAQTAKLVAGLRKLEIDAPFIGFGLGEIAVACALIYFDLRLVIDWRAGHPRLEAWFEAAMKRDALVATGQQIANS